MSDQQGHSILSASPCRTSRAGKQHMAIGTPHLNSLVLSAVFDQEPGKLKSGAMGCSWHGEVDQREMHSRTRARASHPHPPDPRSTSSQSSFGRLGRRVFVPPSPHLASQTIQSKTADSQSLVHIVPLSTSLSMVLLSATTGTETRGQPRRLEGEAALLALRPRQGCATLGGLRWRRRRPDRPMRVMPRAFSLPLAQPATAMSPAKYSSPRRCTGMRM
jgi:hypothetical protein